jgi:hypothetical protein
MARIQAKKKTMTKKNRAKSKGTMKRKKVRVSAKGRSNVNVVL